MKKYAEYKASGIEWIGEVPSEWEVKRLKNCFEFHKGGAWGEEATGNSNDYICIRVADFDYKSLCVNSEDYTMRSYTDAQVKKLQLAKGDLLIEKSGGGENSPVGRIVIFDKDFKALYANFIEAIRVAKNGCSNYYKYLFATLYSIGVNRKFFSQTTGIQNLNVTDYLNEAYPIPPFQTQQAIADYLNRKTAGIDTLIADKQKLIDLLREKRQATISEAVTKGLDKTAKMKDSGIEWIGEIPEDWEVKKLKSVATKIGSGKTPKGGNEVYVDSGVMFLRSQNIHNEGLFLDNVAYITDDMDKGLSNTRLLKNDVLLNITGASIGRACIWDLHGVRGNVNQHVCIIRVGEKIESKFLHYILISSIGQTSIDVYQTGANREGLNFEEIANIVIPFTKIQEQQEIIDYLDYKTAQIDSLISDITEQIEKLKEYRQSIISEVVTGKVAV